MYKNYCNNEFIRFGELIVKYCYKIWKALIGNFMKLDEGSVSCIKLY